jgi:hypothetical protein
MSVRKGKRDKCTRRKKIIKERSMYSVKSILQRSLT